MTETDLRPLQILATAIAGRSVELAAAPAGARTWTDGRTIFLEPDVERRDQQRLLGVQASLLAGGSLDPEVVRELRGRRSLASRYLAAEGHRGRSQRRRPPPVDALDGRPRPGRAARLDG